MRFEQLNANDLVLSSESRFDQSFKPYPQWPLRPPGSEGPHSISRLLTSLVKEHWVSGVTRFLPEPLSIAGDLIGVKEVSAGDQID